MSIIGGKKVKLFSLSANVPLAKEISAASGIELSELNLARFADGEISVNMDESVRGYDVYVVQPTSAPVNEHYMELFIMVDALKRASSNSVTVIMPYYGYSRQDRKAKSRQPITAKLVADLLQTAGVDRVISIDLHAAQIQGFYDIPIDNFPGAPVLSAYFKKKNLQDVVVVSPDHGGATRVRDFAKRLKGSTMAIIDKRRPAVNKAEVLNIIGDVKGKNAIIVDDIIDTAGSLIAAAEALVAAGAKSVYAAATHPVFSNDALMKIEKCVYLKEVVVTNTIQLPPNTPSKVTQLSMGPLMGEAILQLVKDESISQIFDNFGEEDNNK